jgi:plastocyanin
VIGISPARLAVCGLVVATVVACFSERSVGPPETDLTCARAAQPPGPDTAFVIIQGFSYSPVAAQLRPGTRVVWINCEPSGTPGHTATATDGAWDSPILTTGEVFSAVPATGTHDYFCRIHPFMTATIVVQ